MAVQDTLTVDVGALLRGVSAEWKVLLACILIGVICGGVWSLVETQEYEVMVTAVPVDRILESTSQIGAVGDISRLIGVGAPLPVSPKDEAVATLLSRDFLYSFVTDFDLLPVLVPPGWTAGLKSQLGIRYEAKLADAYDRLVRDVLTVEEDRRTGLLTVKTRWSDPETAFAWSNALISRLNAAIQGRVRQGAMRELGYLQKELAKTDTIEIRQAIFRLIEERLKTAMLANQSEDFALRVIDPPILPDIDRPIGFGFLTKVAIAIVLFFAVGMFVVVLKALRVATVR